MKLSELKLGDSAYVTNISNESCISRRLLDIGLIPGTKVECVLVSPAQNPKAYMIRGAVIAIRNEDAFDIDVKYKREG
ncbi:ferrous iron transport protein A [bacterium]|nr:ferrous iron transport protein A [bacterium]